MCYREVISGAEVKLHGDDMRNLKRSPIPTNPEHLFVPYYGSAELGCYLALGWDFPEAIFDVYVAFVMAMYGRLSREQMREKGWRSLVGAVSFVTGEQNAFPEKKAMRELAIRGAPFTEDEMSQLLEYCLDDARANERVLSWAVERTCELPAGPVKAWAQALFRGKFMGAAAIAERNGVSIDVEKLGLIRKHRALIRRRLVKAVDVDFGVCAEDGISPLKLRDYVEEHGLAWPRTRNRLARHRARDLREGGGGLPFFGAAVRSQQVGEGPEDRAPDGWKRRQESHAPVVLRNAHGPERAFRLALDLWLGFVDARVD